MHQLSLAHSPVAVVLRWFDPRLADPEVGWIEAGTGGGEGGSAAAPPTAPPTPRHQGQGGTPPTLLTVGSVVMVAAALQISPLYTACSNIAKYFKMLNILLNVTIIIHCSNIAKYLYYILLGEKYCYK